MLGLTPSSLPVIDKAKNPTRGVDYDDYMDKVDDFIDNLQSRKVKRDFAIPYTGGESMDDSTYFMLFNALWTMVVALPYLVLVPVFFAHLSNIFVTLGIETVTCIFWFAGFIALAASLPDADWCDDWHYCRIAQAATVFGAFEWSAPVCDGSFITIYLPRYEALC